MFFLSPIPILLFSVMILFGCNRKRSQMKNLKKLVSKKEKPKEKRERHQRNPKDGPSHKTSTAGAFGSTKEANRIRIKTQWDVQKDQDQTSQRLKALKKASGYNRSVKSSRNTQSARTPSTKTDSLKRLFGKKNKPQATTSRTEARSLKQMRPRTMNKSEKTEPVSKPQTPRSETPRTRKLSKQKDKKVEESNKSKTTKGDPSSATSKTNGSQRSSNSNRTKKSKKAK